MIDTQGWLIRASLALGLIVIPPAFAEFTANAANFVKTESTHNTTMWVDREMENFPLNPNWKLVRVVVRLHDGSESRQTYLVDYTHSRSVLVEADGQPVPVEEWAWRPDVPFTDGRQDGLPSGSQAECSTG